MVLGFWQETVLFTLAAVGVLVLARQLMVALVRRPKGGAMRLTIEPDHAGGDIDGLLWAAKGMRDSYCPQLEIELAGRPSQESVKQAERLGLWDNGKRMDQNRRDN